MKANRIYLERLRNNDFIDRSPESNIMTLDEFTKRMKMVAEGMEKAAEMLSRHRKL